MPVQESKKVHNRGQRRRFSTLISRERVVAATRISDRCSERACRTSLSPAAAYRFALLWSNSTSPQEEQRRPESPFTSADTPLWEIRNASPSKGTAHGAPQFAHARYLISFLLKLDHWRRVAHRDLDIGLFVSQPAWAHDRRLAKCGDRRRSSSTYRSLAASMPLWPRASHGWSVPCRDGPLYLEGPPAARIVGKKPPPTRRNLSASE